MYTTYVTFGGYLLLMILIGVYFSKRAAGSVENYLLGGRGMGSWVTAMSAQASDMSSWLLMGLPGAVFLGGLSQCWIGIGLAAGTLLNWLVVAPRLRTFTGRTNALTIPTFLGVRFQDKTRILRCLAALLTLVFFTPYAASGLAGAGKLFQSFLGIDYVPALLIGTVVMVTYTLLGGFLAVCWTDLLQGFLMLFAVVVLPLVAWNSLEPGAVTDACQLRDISLSFIPAAANGWEATLIVISMAAWGLGYFGQPHILARFMAIKSVRLLPQATWIAMIWVVVSLGCAVLIGLVAIPLYPEITTTAEAEKVFIYMIGRLFTAMMAGVLLAAILAAVMSTIDSQLLVSSSSLIEDVYGFLIRPRASERELMWVSRISVLLISVIATLLALDPDQSIFSLVKFSWGGLGAAFGPAVLAGLFWRQSNAPGVIAGMVVGMAVLFIWYFQGWGNTMYEIVPAFLANFLTIWVVSQLTRTSESVTTAFDRMETAYKAEKSGEAA